jgi:hypothetical protein
MPWSMIHLQGNAGLVALAYSPEGAIWQRVLGGAGLLVVIVVLLTVPLMLLVRNAARRRQQALRARAGAAPIDAWSESARRMKDVA